MTAGSGSARPPGPYVDLHAHVLPGLDDGARSIEDALELARAAVDDGITTMAATPHVRDDFPTRAETMERALGEVRARLAVDGIPLDLLPGGEIALDRLDALEPSELERFGLAGNPHYLLVEFPYHGWPLDLGARMAALADAGITPVIAHPERNADVQAEPERLRDSLERGALVQLTAASLDGRLGKRPRAACFRLLELGLAHLLASDAHSPALRGVGMSAAVEAVGDPRLAGWLSLDVPAAIAADEPLPTRPAVMSERRRRRWWRRRP